MKVTYQQITQKEVGPSEIELSGEIPFSELEQFRKKVLEEFSEHVAIDGFRKGHIPESVLAAHVGELSLLEAMALKAVREIVPSLIADKKLDVIGRPQVSITKLASGNPVGFSIVTALLPQVTLGDYRKAARKACEEHPILPVEISDADVDSAILTLRRQMTHYEKYHSEGAPGHPSDISHDGSNMKESELLPADDAFAQKIGDFKTMSELRGKMKENLRLEKTSDQASKQRAAIAESIVKEAHADLPNLLIESELDRMMTEFEERTTRMGLQFEEYLKHAKKTKEEMRNDLRGDAKKRVLLHLALNNIAETEKIPLDEKKVARDILHIMEHYSDADPSALRRYVEERHRNERVFEFLEGKSLAVPPSSDAPE